MPPYRFPKLRPIQAEPFLYEGHPCLLLRDPQGISGKALLAPREIGLILPFCDGTREDAGAIGAAVALRLGVRLRTGAIEEMLALLDEALLLDNEKAARAEAEALAAYRAAEYRPPASAGASYPEDPEELRRLLDACLAEAGPALPADETEAGAVTGLVSPHIDYPRGGPVYAKVWGRAREAVEAADLAVILGTGHHGDELLTLTRQHYATPFGVLPTAGDVVERLAGALGETAFCGELHHRLEHSIELAAVWLHHLRGGRPCPVVPILCGSFQRFLDNGTDPAADPALQAAVDCLEPILRERRTVVVAAGDLAHVGPAFGDPPVDLKGRAELAERDEALLARVAAGDAGGFWAAIREVGDRNHVCGLPPIYLALRLLAPCRGEVMAYDRCPADEAGTSLVSIAGVVLRPA